MTMTELSKPEIIQIAIENLIEADWNYKIEGSEQDIAKLANSILKDRSAGIPAVREIGDGRYEVIDGNHRLKALRLLGWPMITCENFGALSKEEAVLISRRRNHVWFEDDGLKYANLVREILDNTEHTPEELEQYMPESAAEIDALYKLVTGDWQQNAQAMAAQYSDNTETSAFKEIKIAVPEEVFELWNQWRERAKMLLGYDNDMKAFEFAIAEAMNIPEESLK